MVQPTDNFVEVIHTTKTATYVLYSTEWPGRTDEFVRQVQAPGLRLIVDNGEQYLFEMSLGEGLGVEYFELPFQSLGLDHEAYWEMIRPGLGDTRTPQHAQENLELLCLEAAVEKGTELGVELQNVSFEFAEMKNVYIVRATSPSANELWFSVEQARNLNLADSRQLSLLE